MPDGSLTIVGTGIRLVGQMTLEAKACIERADEVLHLAADTATTRWIQRLNPRARSLHGFYREGVRRREIYEAMVEEILVRVRRGANVCVAFYGHPGAFVYPSHVAIRRAREEGLRAVMLAAVSAEDCLYADLGVDPGAAGCQSYEATDFLMHRRKIDPSAALILWQIGFLGSFAYAPEHDPSRYLPLLVDYLLEYHPPDHETTLYEASPYAVCEPRIRHARLSELPEAQIDAMATLYVPPSEKPQADAAILAQLGIEPARGPDAPLPPG